MKNIFVKVRGFTLVEILVVIGIIGVLASITLASMSNARENARDKKRIADIAQLELAMRVYVEQYGSDIDCDGGLKIDGGTTVVTLAGSVVCNHGTNILTFLSSFLNTVPADPKGPNDDDYYYYFDNNHSCPSITGNVAMVFAVNMEGKGSNINELCGSASGNNGGLMNTTGHGGSINPSIPYVKLINFTK